jgi:hypothetical protein
MYCRVLGPHDGATSVRRIATALSGDDSLAAFFTRGLVPLNTEGWATRQGMAEEEGRRPSSSYKFNDCSAAQPNMQPTSQSPLSQSPSSQQIDEALLAAEAQEAADLLGWDATDPPEAPASCEVEALAAAPIISPIKSSAEPLALPPGRGWMQGPREDNGTCVFEKLRQCRLQLKKQLDQQVSPTPHTRLHCV